MRDFSFDSSKTATKPFHVRMLFWNSFSFFLHAFLLLWVFKVIATFYCPIHLSEYLKCNKSWRVLWSMSNGFFSEMCGNDIRPLLHLERSAGKHWTCALMIYCVNTNDRNVLLLLEAYLRVIKVYSTLSVSWSNCVHSIQEAMQWHTEANVITCDSH